MGFRDNRDFGKAYYLSFNYNGNLCEKSREEKEGYVPYVNPMTNAPSGFWKEYYNGVVGYLNYIGIRTQQINNINVYFFVVTIKDYALNENYVISIPLYTQKGGISSYVKSFVKYYRNIDINREIVFNAFKKKSTDAFAPGNLIIAYPGEGGKDSMVELYYKNGLNGWPEAEKVMQFGKEKPDYSKQDQFVFDRINEYVNDFNSKIKDVRNALNAAFGNNVTAQDEANNVVYNQQQHNAPTQQPPSQMTQQQPMQQPYQPTGSSHMTPPQSFNHGMSSHTVPQYQEDPNYKAPIKEDYEDLPF
nr:MAG TPA: hypothetical protein [Caudoviricetes sp.]